MHRCAKNSAGLLCGTSCGLWVAFTGLREVLSGHVWPFWLHYSAEEHTGALDPLSVKAEEQHWQRWQNRRGSRSFLAERSETFQSISKHFVPIRCHCHSLRFVADWLGPPVLTGELKRRSVPQAVDCLLTRTAPQDKCCRHRSAGICVVHMPGFSGPYHDLSLAQHLQCVGCDNQNH
jgi:hypothetical protein